MKKLILIITLIITSLFAYAGDNDKIIKDTTINKVVYHLYEGSKGGRYIIRTSKTTGKEYKQYFKHK